MNDTNVKTERIQKEFDYSNIIADHSTVLKLCKYLDDVYAKMDQLFIEEEKKNESLSATEKVYHYKRLFSELDFFISEKNNTTVSFNNYESLVKHLEKTPEFLSLEIRVVLDYQRGSQTMVDFDNSFRVAFRPCQITFTRESSDADNYMNQIEEGINMIFKQFKIANTIFCSRI